MAAIIYIVILIVSFLILVRKNVDEEPNLPFKLIGYYLLGLFFFNFNQISLPIGFVVYLLFFQAKLNFKVKRVAAVVGVVTLLVVHWIIPYAIEEWEGRPIYMEHKLGSVYTMNFQEEYERVKQELKLENNSFKLEDFKVDYTEDGRITDLSWQLLGQNDKKYNLYQIRYEIGKNRYRVVHSQLDTWLQYNRLVDADYFFGNLNVLDIKDITQAKGHFSSFAIQSTGERMNYAVENRNHFFITNEEIQLLDNEELPVEVYYISTSAIEKTGEKRNDRGNITQESFEGTKSSDYLFAVNFVEE